MSALDECVERIRKCTTTRDEGYRVCVQERDDGYRDCCGWIPCKWFCEAWVWIKNIVCVVSKWIENIVCVAWDFITSTVCVIFTVVTLPFCLISRKLTRIFDRIGALVNDIVEGIAGTVIGIVGGIVYFFTHPAESLATIINLFRGCPSVRSDVIARGGPADILVIAHHGYTKIWPENTAQACNAALRRGADALEVDLCFTSDSQVICWHDWNPDHATSLARQSGMPSGQAYYPSVPAIGSSWRTPVDQLTLIEFRQHYGYSNEEDAADRIANDIRFGSRDTTIPTLGEFLADVDRHGMRRVFLDIKMPGSASERAGEMVDKIHEALVSAELARAQAVLMIPDFAVLEAMKQRAEEMQYGLAFTWDIEFPPGVILNPLRYSAINHAVTPFHNTVASVGKPTGLTLFPWKTYRRTIEYDIGRWNEVNADPGGQNSGNPIELLIAWTLDDEDELRCLVRMGVAGIITNAPELLAKILGRTI
jgi:glycerophosphoryl diester phosphodiesterase